MKLKGWAEDALAAALCILFFGPGFLIWKLTISHIFEEPNGTDMAFMLLVFSFTFYIAVMVTVLNLI
jgi:hypothetical protein